MLTPFASDRRRALAQADGFTLIEMVLALSLASIVMVALVMMVNLVLDQSSNAFTNIDATENARVKLEQIENELHSACIGNEVAPVQADSTATQLSFISAFGNAASVTPVEHVIALSNGALTDTTYAETSETAGTPPTYTFSSSPSSTTTVLINVSQLQSPITPVFQYFPYGEVWNGSGYYEDPAGNPYEVLLDGNNYVPNTSPSYLAPADDLVTSTAPSLSASNAASVAEVEITLEVGPYVSPQESTDLPGAPLANNGDLTVQDSVVLRLTDPANHVGTGAEFGPCE